MSEIPIYSARVVISYTNHEGETRDRIIVPERISFMSTQWHKEPQWILYARAMDRGGAIRGFAMRDIHSWRPE